MTLDEMVEHLALNTREFLMRRIAPVDARVQTLERRLAALERRALAYRGVWHEANAPYRPNEIVTDAGTVWCCLRETSARPGTSDWQLMVKSR